MEYNRDTIMTEVLEGLLAKTKKDGKSKQNEVSIVLSDTLANELCSGDNNELPETVGPRKENVVEQPDSSPAENEETTITIDIQPGPPARFTPESSITLIFGPPKRGKSHLLKQMYKEPPHTKTPSGKQKQAVDSACNHIYPF